MSSRPPIKCYITRGIQTDPVLFFCETREADIISLSQAATQVLPSGLSLDYVIGHALSVSENGSAYTQSHPLAPTNLRQAEKLASLGSRYPSATGLPPRRIVSFPASSSPRLPQALTAKQRRVVSMPENRKGHDEPSHRSSQVDGSFSTETSQNIMEEQLWERVYVKPYPGDLPHTPSPPSSPDSLIIVDGTHLCDPHFQRSQAEDDWTVWASSPPRPIPALHGPLSLPYARCPSGAEGTVIEGQDLSHKIWGLGSDDVQGSSRPKRGTPAAHIEESLPSHSNNHRNPDLDSLESIRQHLQAPVLSNSREAVIDLSKPATFHPNIHPQSMALGSETINFTLSNGARSKYSVASSDPSQPGNIGSDRANSGNIWLTSGDKHAPFKQKSNVPLQQYSYGNENPWKGLGIPNVMSFRNVHSSEKTENKLNKAAPVFVPGNSGISANMPWAHIPRPENSSSIQLEMTRQKPLSNGLHRIWKGEQNTSLLATPSTTSSQWSPIFSLTTPDLNAPRMAITTSTRIASSYDPSVNSPYGDHDELYSNKLANIQHQHYSSIQEMNDFTKQDEYSELLSRHRLHLAKQTITNDPTKQVLSGSRPNLSQQHPRSIPLAKLIQRRLSSVPEELLGSNKIPTNARMETISHSMTQTIIEPSCTHSQILSGKTDVGTESVEVNAIVKLPTKNPPLDKTMKQVEGATLSNIHGAKRDKENKACNKNAKPAMREGRNKKYNKGPITPKTSA